LPFALGRGESKLAPIEAAASSPLRRRPKPAPVTARR
jgi:hypothetical protein